MAGRYGYLILAQTLNLADVIEEIDGDLFARTLADRGGAILQRMAQSLDGLPGEVQDPEIVSYDFVRIGSHQVMTALVRFPKPRPNRPNTRRRSGR